jgi:ferrochelatase
MGTTTSGQPPLGVLLTNLGTPDAPNPPALRRYLGEFLWDPRVVETPRLPWWLILNGFILRTRPRRSAEAYRRVWTEQGSPLAVISQRQPAAVQRALDDRLQQPVKVALGMRYGNPSIASALEALKAAGVERLLVLPLYPQYSASTAASTFDAIAARFGDWRVIPSLRFIRDYHDDAGYIQAVAAKIRRFWDEHGRGERLLMSFHGLPKRFADLGDPYAEQCRASAAAIAEELGLGPEQWLATFQSRFGPAEWLQPYTDKTLEQLAGERVRRIDLVCPGFSADCLETLEENAMVNRDLFLAAGGEQFQYIPCLNDDPEHIQALADLIQRELGGWL